MITLAKIGETNLFLVVFIYLQRRVSLSLVPFLFVQGRAGAGAEPGNDGPPGDTVRK